MARFPLSEAEIMRLAQNIITGLLAHPEDFPAPPVSPERLRAALDAFAASRGEALLTAARAVQATAAKAEDLLELVDLMKSNLRYAENHTRAEPIKLHYLGWGPRRKRAAKDAPGQVLTLQMVQEIEGGVVLSWKEPVDGGPVTAYKVQRRRRDGGGWVNVGTSMETGIVLDNQEPGFEYEYQVLAVNKSGDGPPSNMVRAVL